MNPIDMHHAAGKQDIPRGDHIRFRCFRTNEEYRITSALGENCHNMGEEPMDASTSGLVRRVDGDTGSATYVMMDSDEQFTKKKHYYFYSKQPNFGKSTVVGMLMQYTNSTMIRHVKDFSGVNEDAQFLVMDEYGTDVNVFSMEDIRRLTSGNASVFMGRIKGAKRHFEPRPDAQLLIFGNTHLFDTLGKMDKKDGCRKVSHQDAAMIVSRFHIHRMDESDSNETEEEDRARHSIGDNLL